MYREATIDRVDELTAAAGEGAQLVVLPEAFVPGTPTLAQGDGWVATMQHLARENRMYVVGVNPVLHVDDLPTGFPDLERLVPAEYVAEHGPWIETGNTVIVGPDGALLAGPLREEQGTLFAELDLAEVASARRFMDPTGHYNRPDVFQLLVDTTSRRATTTTGPPEQT